MVRAATRKRSTRRLQRLTAAGKLLEMIAMRHVPQSLHAVAVLGIADLLAAGAKSSDELAQATGSHARTLYRVLRTLAAAGVFAEDEGVGPGGISTILMQEPNAALEWNPGCLRAVAAIIRIP